MLSCREIMLFPNFTFVCSCPAFFLESDITMAWVLSAAKVTFYLFPQALMFLRCLLTDYITLWVCSLKSVSEGIKSSASAFAVWMICRRSLTFLPHSMGTMINPCGTDASTEKLVEVHPFTAVPWFFVSQIAGTGVVSPRWLPTVVSLVSRPLRKELRK